MTCIMLRVIKANNENYKKTGYWDNAIQGFLIIELAIMVYQPIYHNLQIIMVSVHISLNLKKS